MRAAIKRGVYADCRLIQSGTTAAHMDKKYTALYHLTCLFVWKGLSMEEKGFDATPDGDRTPLSLTYPMLGHHGGPIASLDMCLRKPLLVTCCADDRCPALRIWNYRSRQCITLESFEAAAMMQVYFGCSLHYLILFMAFFAARVRHISSRRQSPAGGIQRTRAHVSSVAESIACCS